MENKTEIQDLLKIVLEARIKTREIEHDIEQSRKTQRAIKETNDERIRKIQDENRELDSELAAKEMTLNKTMSEIKSQIHETRWKLLRRIILCNLKNLLNGLQATNAPENILSTIYTGQFAVVYDDITLGSKPINQYSWIVRIKLADDPAHLVHDFLNAVWFTYKEIHWGWGDDRPQFFQRDFKSEEEAKAYAERNRAKVCQKLLEGIKQVEREIETANGNIDEVFDFRLIMDSVLDPQYSHTDKFQVVSAEKHQLIVTPLLSRYDREFDKTQPYAITITQQGYQLTIEGHRFPNQARDIKYAIHKYFNTEFKAIEVDTQQEIQNPW